MNNYKNLVEEIIFKKIIYNLDIHLTVSNNCFIICTEFK